MVVNGSFVPLRHGNAWWSSPDVDCTSGCGIATAQLGRRRIGPCDESAGCRRGSRPATRSAVLNYARQTLTTWPHGAARGGGHCEVHGYCSEGGSPNARAPCSQCEHGARAVGEPPSLQYRHPATSAVFKGATATPPRRWLLPSQLSTVVRTLSH